MKRNTHIDRVALAVPGQRQDLGITRRELAACAEVSTTTIARIEAGIRVNPALVTRVALALTALELAAPPKATLEDELAALVRVAL